MSHYVLIVEDNLDQSELIRIAFKRSAQSFQMVFVTSGQACLEQCATENFDAILLDYKLPDLTGLEVLNQLRDQGIKTPVIIVTGQGDEKVAVEAMKSGAADYVVKEHNYLATLPKLIASVIDRCRLRQQLREKEAFLASIVENASDIIFSLDHNLNFRFVNPKINKLGYQETDLLGKSFFSILATKYKPEDVAKILNNPEEENYEFDFADHHGKVQHQIVSFTRLTEKGDPNYAILGIAKDVTEILQLHRMIQESKSKLQTLFDSITDYIVVLDRQKSIVMANRKVATLKNTTSDRVLGLKCYNLYSEDPHYCDDCVVEKTFQSAQPEYMECGRGDRIHQVWTYPMFNLEGELEFVIEYSRDVTEQKNIERKLIQAEKLATIGLLASGVAHELRNPLNIIETARYYIQDVLKNENPDLQAKLQIINRNVHRASNIINNLLEFSRPSTQAREQIDVNLIIDKTLSLIEKDLRSQNITVNKQYHEIPLTFLNMDSLKQVFLNIIINAIQAMPDGGDLTIATGLQEEHWIQIKFTDTGYGIAKEHLSSIFTPFFTTKDMGQGTGLGMYVSHSIIKREGGDILIESVEGKGTTFKVLLPIKADQNH